LRRWRDSNPQPLYEVARAFTTLQTFNLFSPPPYVITSLPRTPQHSSAAMFLFANEIRGRFFREESALTVFGV
jgi:hypothetical protein